jgi:hypothetical protein
MALLFSLSQEYCNCCSKRLSACLIRSHTHYHPYCRSSSSISSQPASTPVSAFVVTPITPAIILSLICSSSSSSAPSRTHHGIKVNPCMPMHARSIFFLLNTSTRCSLIAVCVPTAMFCDMCRRLALFVASSCLLLSCLLDIVTMSSVNRLLSLFLLLLLLLSPLLLTLLRFLFSTGNLALISLSLLSNAQQQSCLLELEKHNRRQQNSLEQRDKPSLIGSVHLRRRGISKTN